MKHSDPAPLYKNAGINARGKDAGNPCPVVQGHVGLAAVEGWVRAWCGELASSWVGAVEKQTQEKRNWRSTQGGRKKREGEKPQTETPEMARHTVTRNLTGSEKIVLRVAVYPLIHLLFTGLDPLTNVR